MRVISEKQALFRLRRMKAVHKLTVREGYEHRAKDCLTCETKGACCLDAHFVNVHITPLEAALIREELANLPDGARAEAEERIAGAVEKYGLADDPEAAFACPLFEKGTGCLVHEVKPAPCIQHACYESPADLPPDSILEGAEEEIDKLNQRVYRRPTAWLPLPLALKQK